MRHAFIVEQFNLQEDFQQAFNNLQQLLDKGDESDILYETIPNKGEFETLVKSRFDVTNASSTKLHPQIFFNQLLMNRIGLKLSEQVFD